ncbi:MAG: bifunctional nuclease domain-containing protein [Flavobacteriales bacterium]
MSHKKIELFIADIQPSGSTTGAYALVLKEVDGLKKLAVVIGGAEAQSIALELEKMKPTRPLTHDLFRSLAQSFEIDVQEVVIYNLIEGIYYARLVVSMDGKSAEIDSRTSDAVAIAVRFNCPIYCLDFILDTAGSIGDEDEDESEDPFADPPQQEDEAEVNAESLTLDELKEQLNQAIDMEDYELASRLRDEINRREE